MKQDETFPFEGMTVQLSFSIRQRFIKKPMMKPSASFCDR